MTENGAAIQERLTMFLRNAEIRGAATIRTDQSLIKSGLVDSQALFRLVIWIEQETGAPIDLQEVNLSRDLDTINDIVAFVDKHREHA